MIKEWISQWSKLTKKKNPCRHTNHSVSIQITTALKAPEDKMKCMYWCAHVCMSPTLVNLNELCMALENDCICNFLVVVWDDWVKERWRKLRSGGGKVDKLRKKRWQNEEWSAQEGKMGGKGEIAMKKIATERDIARERVSMFETSHWFLLSGMLVSQELDCSTLPLTDSRPAV